MVRIYLGVFPHFLMIDKSHVAVYVDESGDLGFSEKSILRSPIFIIAYLVPENPLRLSNDLKKFLKHIKFKAPELKFHNDSWETRFKILNFLQKRCIFKAGYVAISKTSVKNELKEKPNILYNYLAVHYVITAVMKTYNPFKITYVIDKSMKQSRRLEFNEYLTRKTWWTAIQLQRDKPTVPFKLEEFKTIPEIIVKHEDSRKDACLQIVDYLSGVIGQAFKGNRKYYEVIINKFREDWKVTWSLPTI